MVVAFGEVAIVDLNQRGVEPSAFLLHPLPVGLPLCPDPELRGAGLVGATVIQLDAGRAEGDGATAMLVGRDGEDERAVSGLAGLARGHRFAGSGD